MNGESLERIQQFDTFEKNGLLIRREVWENGIRVVSIESLEKEHELPGVVEHTRLDLPEKLDSHISRLSNCLETTEGRLSVDVREAVMSISRHLNSGIRGVCEAHNEMQVLPEDGIVYIPVQLEQRSNVVSQIRSILDQLNKYSG